jgi:hypothetical protein
MDVRYVGCCGIDVHNKSITVCVLIREAGQKEQKHIREFGTTTARRRHRQVVAVMPLTTAPIL